MKIGIICFSRTGHTASVGEEILKLLRTDGHDAYLERINVANDDPKSKEPIRFTTNPDISKYDAIILGGPVIGGQLSPVMREYLARLPSLHEKKVACFITQHFPWKWMGGTNSLRQMISAAENKGSRVSISGIVQWSSKNRDAQIRDLASCMRQI